MPLFTSITKFIFSFCTCFRRFSMYIFKITASDKSNLLSSNVNGRNRMVWVSGNTKKHSVDIWCMSSRFMRILWEKHESEEEEKFQNFLSCCCKLYFGMEMCNKLFFFRCVVCLFLFNVLFVLCIQSTNKMRERSYYGWSFNLANRA